MKEQNVILRLLPVTVLLAICGALVAAVMLLADTKEEEITHGQLEVISWQWKQDNSVVTVTADINGHGDYTMRVDAYSSTDLLQSKKQVINLAGQEQHTVITPKCSEVRYVMVSFYDQHGAKVPLKINRPGDTFPPLSLSKPRD